LSKMTPYIINNKMIDEGSSDDAYIDFKEFAKFYQVADKTEIDKMKTFITDDDWNGFKKLIYQVLKTKQNNI
jgi:hypothetical protein